MPENFKIGWTIFWLVTIGCYIVYSICIRFFLSSNLLVSVYEERQHQCSRWHILSYLPSSVLFWCSTCLIRKLQGLGSQYFCRLHQFVLKCLLLLLDGFCSLKQVTLQIFFKSIWFWVSVIGCFAMLVDFLVRCVESSCQMYCWESSILSI